MHLYTPTRLQGEGFGSSTMRPDGPGALYLRMGFNDDADREGKGEEEFFHGNCFA